MRFVSAGAERQVALRDKEMIRRDNLFQWAALGLLGVILWMTPGAVSAQNLTTRTDKGSVDWTNRIVEVFGVGRAPSNPVNIAQARSIAQKRSLAATRENLLETVLGLRVDAGRRVRDLLKGRPEFTEYFRALVQEAQVVDISYLPNGAVKTALSLHMDGRFGEKVLPEEIRMIHPIKQPEGNTQSRRPVYSGLVIDARGLEAEPAFVPRILDEEGAVVYGPAYISRDYAIKRGVAGYVTDLDAALEDARVAGKPLVLKAIRTTGEARCDIVISQQDADRVRGTASNLNLLHECRVMIVLD